MLKNKRYWLLLPLVNLLLLIFAFAIPVIMTVVSDYRLNMIILHIWTILFCGGFFILAMICGLFTFRKNETWKVILKYSLFSMLCILVVASVSLVFFIHEITVIFSIAMALEETLGFFLGATIWKVVEKKIIEKSH